MLSFECIIDIHFANRGIILLDPVRRGQSASNVFEVILGFKHHKCNFIGRRALFQQLSPNKFRCEIGLNNRTNTLCLQGDTTVLYERLI